MVSAGSYSRFVIACVASLLGCEGCQQQIGEDYVRPPIHERLAHNNRIGEIGQSTAYDVRYNGGDNHQVTLQEGQDLVIDFGFLRYGGGVVNHHQVVALANMKQVDYVIGDYQGVEHTPTGERVIVSDLVSEPNGEAVLKTIVVPYEHFSRGRTHDFRIALLLNPTQAMEVPIEGYESYIPSDAPTGLLFNLWISVKTPAADELVQNAPPPQPLRQVDNLLQQESEWGKIYGMSGFALVDETLLSGPNLSDEFEYEAEKLDLNYLLWPTGFYERNEESVFIAVFNQGRLDEAASRTVKLRDARRQGLERVSAEAISVDLMPGANRIQLIGFPSPLTQIPESQVPHLHRSNVLLVNRVVPSSD